MFTNQHYRAIAKLFSKVSATNKDFFVGQFAILFVLDNPRFIKEKFIKACYDPTH